MVNTKVTLCGIEMDNPIIPASGTFGFGYEFAELYDINMLGTFSFKGTTREPRFGNPTPRIAEYAGGLLNAVGLQNPGVDAVIETELPKLKQVFHKPVMANISGFSVAEYAEVCEKLDAQEQVGWLEVNISCPNVHGGGAARAHAVTQDHLGSGRAAELLDRIPGDSALCRRARSSEHGPEGGLFAEEQGGHPFAGEYLRRVKVPAADAPGLLRQRGQLGGRKAGAGQGDRRPCPA